MCDDATRGGPYANHDTQDPAGDGIVQVGRKLWNPKAWMLSH